jgi:glycosyltransferase involved in cell wall biosynthesis
MGRVLVLAVALPPPVTGQSTVNAAMATAFASHGVEVSVVDISPGLLVRGWSYHVSRLIKVLLGYVTLVHLSRAKPRDLCFYTVVESGFGIVYNFGFVGLARLLGYRIYLHHHTSGHTLQRRRAFGWLAQLAGSEAWHIVLGPAMATDLATRYPIVRNLTILNNAIHIRSAHDVCLPSDRGGVLRVGLLSNLFAEKGLDLAIDSVVEAQSGGADISLVLAGPIVGKDAELHISRARSSLGSCLDVRGPISGAEKDRFFRDIDVFLFPTRYRYEAQPLVVLEAMSYGLPVIVTDRGYTRELVEGCGWVIDVRSDIKENCADALAILCHDPLLRAESGQRSLNRFLEWRSRARHEYEILIVSMWRGSESSAPISSA